MAGAATTEIRSAIVAETVAGTIPATPGFATSHALLAMKATPQKIDSRSQLSGGARMGHGITEIQVTGELPATPLIYGVYDVLLETLFQGTWTADVLKDGKDAKTFAVENTVPAGAGGTETMLRFRGVEAISGTLTLTALQAATLNMSMLGLGSDDATTTAIAGATYTDPTEADPLSSGSDIGTIVWDGYTLDCMESLEISFAYEGRDAQGRITSDDYCGVTRGAFLPILTANMYIEANFLAIYNAARDRTHAGFKVTVPIGSVTGEKYTLEFHNCHFGETEIDMGGTNVMQMITILPEYDTTEQCVCTITRAVA